MERRMRTALRIGLPVFVALAALALTTCDSANILAMLTTEVKKSTGKLLVVSAVTPSNTTTNVNPGARMTVTFDRVIDVSTVSSSTITISPIPSALQAPGFRLDFTFNDATRTLYIDPNPWLGDAADYTLMITTGVKGADGSEPEKDYSWSFRTGTFPKGNIAIEADKTYTNKGPGQKLNLTIKPYKPGYFYRLGSTEAECLASTTWYTASSTNYADGTSYGFPTSTLDGLQSVYVQFQDNLTTDVSLVRSDTITLDTVQPTITVSTPTVYHNLAGPASPVVSGSDDRSGVDATTWLWTNNNTTMNLTAAQAPSISVTGSENVAYPVTVTVKDIAGNTSSAATVNVIKDTVAPNAAPTLTPPASPAFAQMPTWTWSPNSTEATHTYRLEVAGSNGYTYTSSSTTATTFYRRTMWPDYSKGLQPGTYTVNLWERDAAGNLAGPATSTTTVTSVLPVNGATGVPLLPTFQWWTMYYKSSTPKAYLLHYGTWDGRTFKEIAGIEVAQPSSADPSYALKSALTGLRTYGWYVEWRETGLRSPPLDARPPYWTFTTGKF